MKLKAFVKKASYKVLLVTYKNGQVIEEHVPLDKVDTRIDELIRNYKIIKGYCWLN